MSKYSSFQTPMGWNSYDYYDTNVTEEAVLQNARYMAKHLKSYGWEYVVVDIQWYAYHTASMRSTYQYIPFGRNEMDAFGRLMPCPDKFPSSVGGAGFKPLADQIHALGLKFGIHIMRGIPRLAAHLHLPILGTDVTADMVADPSSICPWNPDMYGIRNSEAGQKYYDSLLQLYASWGVDYIKCDDICATGDHPRNYSRRHEVEMLHNAIEKCGRPILLSLSPGPALVDESWHYSRYANMWRITDDLWDNWGDLRNMFERCEKWQDHVRPGCWPDCDMLPLGRIGKHFGQERTTRLTADEQKTMMSLWCIFGSPLMLGAELTLLDDWTLSLLQNQALLHLLNGKFVSRQVLRDADKCLWIAIDPATGECYMAIFNLSDRVGNIHIPFAQCDAAFSEGWVKLESGEWIEVWSDKRYTFMDTIGGDIPPHGVLLFHKI